MGIRVAERSSVRPEQKRSPREGTVRSEVGKRVERGRVHQLTPRREAHILEQAQSGKMPPEKALLRLSGETRNAVYKAAKAKRESQQPSSGEDVRTESGEQLKKPAEGAEGGDAAQKAHTKDTETKTETKGEDTAGEEAKAQKERQERIDTVTDRVQKRLGENLNDKQKAKIKAAIEGVVDQFDTGSEAWKKLIDKLDKLEETSLGKRQAKDIVRLLDSIPTAVTRAFKKAGKLDEAEGHIRAYEAQALTATPAELAELKKKFRTTPFLVKLFANLVILLGAVTYEGLKANSLQDLIG